LASYYDPNPQVPNEKLGLTGASKQPSTTINVSTPKTAIDINKHAFLFEKG
jgi:hypothetical protein